ncbi:hypothetical protein Val02_33450 [Virgisporangium aliadipatigenens]|uniref:HYDIN/VesB/CFA65-like Ig-like domain-containing protein n=1 Tax=Virgisporangium aliadipatigenens TaxID=741659 RepID=A0A8J3YJH9_9ACTN|nr:choice-of-anchor D domain-containing protein [Virgisporangium aliadipatigenens]GIJ46459.1 hypothetical protein Val02_33450 [Virgisporangium aliadipatigenens]
MPSTKLRTFCGRGLLTLALAAGAIAVTPTAAPADVYTNAQDDLRTGWDRAEPGLTPSTVTGSNFGQLFATHLDGQVYAQPIVVGNTVLVGTENDKVYGLDATTGAVKWSRDFGPPWPASAIGCADLTPNLGNTATGVYDPATQTYYVSTKVNDGPDLLHPNWYLHALDAQTGAERTGWPVLIAGTPPNDPNHPFNGKDVNQRPGLLLMNGAVYLAFGSQCGYGLYNGWVVGVNTTTRDQDVWATQTGPSDQGAGIWQGGGGIVSDGAGRMFVSTGNGVVPPVGPGNAPPATLGEAVVRLGVGADGTISAQDFFSPSNAPTLNTNFQDLGSGGPVGLPGEFFGTAATPNLMVVMGKDGRLFVLNRDDLGGRSQGAGGTDKVVQTLGPYSGMWGRPAVYGGQGGYVYAVQNANTMLAFRYGLDGQGKPAFSLAGNTAEIFGYTSGSPIVTSDGTTPGSATVWVVQVAGPNGADGKLCAYDAIPSNNRVNLLRCFPIGTATKFSTPASSNGRVYVGTRDGYLYGFGQPTTSPLSGVQTTFGNVTVGTTGTAKITATATRTVTVNSVTNTGPFTVNGTQPALPVTLTAGQKITVDATFSPTAPGSVTGTLNFGVTHAGVPETVGFGLHGNGIRAGFTASPPQLDFGDIAVGSSKTLTTSFTNTGTSDATVTAAGSPAAPFSVSGLPATGAVVAPGQSVTVAVTFSPTTAEAKSAELSLSSVDGAATVPLNGRGVTGNPELTVSPGSLSFGEVPLGAAATRTLRFTNTGNINLTITKAGAPTAPFVVDSPLPEGTVISPDQYVEVQIRFQPGSLGNVTGDYLITADDGHGPRHISMSGTGVASRSGSALPSVGNGAWFANGSAQINANDIVLTPADRAKAGSVIFSTPLATNGLSASFTADIGGGSGGDGMTLSLLDPSATTQYSLGGGGSALGFGALKGIAVTLDTYQSTGDPSANFVGIAHSVGSDLVYLQTTTNVPALRGTSRAVRVTVVNNVLTVWVDGVQRIQRTVTLPPTVRVGLTAGTGGAYDRHAVRDVQLSSGATVAPKPGKQWHLGGSATMDGANLVLTPAQQEKAGAAFWSDAVQTDGLAASFTTSMGGGNGADGMTFSLLDPAAGGPARVGPAGGGLGVAGLGGVSVAFVSYPQAGVIESYNWVGIATHAPNGNLVWLATNTSASVPELRQGNHNAIVRVTGKTVSLTVDGIPLLSAEVPSLTRTAYAGFSGGTGGFFDHHTVSNVTILPGAPVVPVPPQQAWTYNGSTTASGNRIQLTPATVGATGTAIYGTPVPTGRLYAEFTTEIGGGSGADGMTFMLLDPARTNANALGQGGGGLGYAGLPGVAVTFVTFAQQGDPSSNFVGVATGGTPGALQYAARSTNVPNLRAGTHHVEVFVDAAGTLKVKIDSVQVIEVAVPVPANALLGFSGSCGGVTDVHAVKDLHISY